MSSSEKLPPQIFVIEPDEIQRTTLCNIIERSLFTVMRAESAKSSSRIMALDHPNVVVISSNLSDVPAYKLALELRVIVKKLHQVEIPIVFILNRNDDQIPYRNLDNGLVEVLYRPFTPDEIVTIIKSLLRRSNPVLQDKILRYKDLSMDLATFKVYRGDRRIRIGPTEFKILQLLFKQPKSILSRQHIIDYVWGDSEIYLRTVDVHINRLRTVIRNNKFEPPIIKTVRASGYCLNLPGEVD